MVGRELHLLSLNISPDATRPWVGCSTGWLLPPVLFAGATEGGLLLLLSTGALLEESATHSCSKLSKCWPGGHVGVFFTHLFYLSKCSSSVHRSGAVGTGLLPLSFLVPICPVLLSPPPPPPLLPLLPPPPPCRFANTVLILLVIKANDDVDAKTVNTRKYESYCWTAFFNRYIKLL